MPSDGPRTPAIVLAAGRGRRLGDRTKPLVELGGRPILARVLEACRAGGAVPRIVVLAAEADAIEEACDLADLADVTVRRHDDPDAGLALSIQRGLKACPPDAEGALVWPVDVPLPDGELVRRLREAFAARPDEERIVCPSHDMRRGHPVLFGRSLFGELMRLGPDDPPHRVVRAHADEIRYVETDDRCLLDVDTPEDLEQARWRVEGG